MTLHPIVSVLFTMLSFLAVLSVVVVIHELGHYWAARYYRVKILAFSFGFGPELWHRIDRHGVRWRVAAFPLGGYVKMHGDENAASMPDNAALERMSAAEREGAFQAKPLGQRAVVIAAGPGANFVLAILIFAGIFWLRGEPYAPPVVDQVTANSAAAAAGFKPGDRILAVNGTRIDDFSEIRRFTSVAPGSPLTFQVESGGVQRSIVVTPQLKEVDTGFGRTVKIGQVGLAPKDRKDWETRIYSLPGAVVRAVSECVRVIGDTLNYLWRVVTLQTSGDQISGPLGIAAASGKVASLGILPMLIFIAAMSVNVGFANLLPIPILDGGHLLFYAIEKIKGSPLDERTQEYAFRFGLAVLVMLFLYAFRNDLGIDWGSVLPGRPRPAG
jgi:regulator of sigma E protease